MTALALNDLGISKELDNEALAAVRGRGTHWTFVRYGANWYGNWPYDGSMSSSFQGYRYLHGRKHAAYCQISKNVSSLPESKLAEIRPGRD